MTDTAGLTIQIQSSKIYLTLSIMVYLLVVFCAWYYFYSFQLSIVISIGLSIWLYYHLPKSVFLTNTDAIRQITLNENGILIKKNNKLSVQYADFYPVYQSRFLVIITAQKELVVIFKDSINAQSLSTLNRFLNANS